VKKKKPERISYFQKTVFLRKAGIGFAPVKKRSPDNLHLEDLPVRIKILLDIFQKPIKKTDTMYLIMYDIEDNKVRTQIAKYLIRAGCIRIQKSVYIAQTARKQYLAIKETLSEVQQMYENNDSVLIVPVSRDELKAMNVIGKNIDISLFTEDPNTLFF